MCYNLQAELMQGILTMIKYFLVFMLIVTPIFSKTIGAVALTVNSNPITVYEIQKLSTQKKISKEDAVNSLIQEKIEQEQIQKLGIFATPDEIKARIAEIAKQNNLSKAEFEKALQKEGKSISSLKKDIEKVIKKEKLYQKILEGKMKRPTEDEMKNFYEEHKQEFTIPGKIKIQEYTSKDPKALQAIQMRPMLMLPNVNITTKILNPKETNPKLFQFLLQTPTKTFTPIVNLGQNMAMFFILEKSKPVTASFDQVKQNIFVQLMKEQEQANLISYFEKKKSEANIKVIRKP